MKASGNIRKYIHVLTKPIRVIINIIGYFDPRFLVKYRFFRLYKRFASEKNPTTLSEVIISRMLKPSYRRLAPYVDKLQVREYIRETIGEEYLIPMLAVYETPSEIDYESIPEGAYMKLNHGSGQNYVYRQNQKEEIHKKICAGFERNYSREAGEQQYAEIVPRILVQQNITAADQVLQNFSFFMFCGQVEFVQIWDNQHHRYEVDPDYQPLPFQLYSRVTPVQEKPAEFETMRGLAQRVGSKFSFARVDFFLSGHKIYFGEITFSPSAGIFRFTPDEYNCVFAEKLKGTDLFIDP